MFSRYCKYKSVILKVTFTDASVLDDLSIIYMGEPDDYTEIDDAKDFLILSNYLRYDCMTLDLVAKRAFESFDVVVNAGGSCEIKITVNQDMTCQLLVNLLGKQYTVALSDDRYVLKSDASITIDKQVVSDIIARCYDSWSDMGFTIAC